jgi:diacylglycerol kinase
VLLAAALSGFSIYEWVTLAFTIFFVLVMELVNTSVENIVDLVSPDVQPKAKVAKDVSAAAVLLSTFMSILVGVLLFLPRIIQIIS